MPKATPNQENFNAGEVSPLLYGRVKAPRYSQGLATCLNYLPLLQGPATRRPGTKYANGVKDSTKPPILVPFEFSETQAYMLEFGDRYIRFFANNAAIVTSGTSHQVQGSLAVGSIDTGSILAFNATRANLSPRAGETILIDNPVVAGTTLELVSPYLVADLPLLRWCQNADTLYLFHPSYTIKKLQRYGNAYWTLRDVYVQDGPYIGLSSYEALGDNTNVLLSPASAAVAGTVVTCTVSSPFAISGAVAGTGGTIKITSAVHGWATGQKVYISGVTGTTEANSSGNSGSTSPPSYWVITVKSTTTFELVGSTFVNAYVAGGFARPALFTDNTFPVTTNVGDLGRSMALIQGAVRTYGIVASVLSPISVNFLIDPNSPNLTNTNPSVWQLGSWSYNAGFPACGCFHQNRLMLAGATNFPTEIDGSQSGTYENFGISRPTDLTVVASDGLQFPLVANDVNAIHWLKSNSQGLLAGAYGGEWSISPSSTGDALTPTNFNAQKTSAYGAAKAEAVQVGNAVLYIQNAHKKVREMSFFFYAGTFRSTDLTELSEHITLPAIKQIVSQKSPANLTWGLRYDGQLVTLTYDRDDQNLRTGWARHTLGGASDSAGSPPVVLSMAVIPSPDALFDQLWLVVQRWINGASVVTIEYMTKINDAGVLQEDAFQGDCGVTYDTQLIITGISSANPAVVTSNAHGLSNGDQIRITDVTGLNKSTTDADGNVTVTNLVNEKTFVVAGVAANTFQLHDFSGNAVTSIPYSAYVSGGIARKMVLTISGLSWLHNETVGVLADGAIHADVVVSNSGVATLNYRAAKVQFGYRYNSDGQQLRLDSGSATGSSIGLTRRVSRVAMMLYRVGDLLWGMSFSRLLPQSFQQADVQVADQATPLFSGIQSDAVESGYDSEGQFCFRQSSMLPGTIQSITQILEEQDR